MHTKRYAIVTGAGSGLGRAIALELARRGWHVALADIDSEGAGHTHALIKEAGSDAQVEQLDVTNPDQWQALRGKLESSWPSLDLLVNNAGVGVGGEVGRLPLEDWHWIININLYGAIYGCHTLIDWMKRNSRGAHIVNIASLAAVVSAPSMAPYNVTKAGMVSLSETLYGELKPYNIGVTAVCPAFFQTNIVRSGRFQNARQRNMAAKLMSSSKLSAEDVAKKILRAVERKRLYVFAPTIAGVFWRLKRLMPVRLLNMVSRQNERQTSRSPSPSGRGPE